MKTYLEKVTAKESKNHYIKNSIVLAFSLIILIVSFFVGAEFDLMLDGGLAVPIQHDFIQVAEGSLAFLESNKQKISDYIENFDGYKILQESEEYCRGKVDQGVTNELDLLNEMGRYISAHSNANFIKFSVFVRKTSSPDVSNVSGMMEELYVKGGSGIGIWAVAMQFCAMLLCLINAIRASIALIKRKQIDNLGKKIMLPFAFLLAKSAMILTNPMLKIDIATYVLMAIYVLFIVLLCACKYLLEQSATGINVPFIAKNVTLMLLGTIACFTAVGSLISFNINNIATFHYSAGELMNVYTMYTLGMLQRNGEVTESILLGFCSYLAYLPLVICAATMGYSALRNIYEKIDNPESKYGKTLMARVIATLFFLVLITVGISWMGNSLHEYGIIAYKPAVSANIIVSLVVCIALIVVNIAWKIKPVLMQNPNVDNN